MLALHDVRFRYPDAGAGDAGFALHVPELRVAKGERVAVVGPSGSGKTTLLHLIAGILVPDAGTIRVGETDVAGLSEARRRAFRVERVGLVFQELELLEYLDVLENVLLPYRIHPALRLGDEARERARRLADQLGIGHRLERAPRALSQGERQRAAVCRALVTRPPLLLADEPTGNLDPGNKRRVLDALFAVAAEAEATLLVVTHDHELLSSFDRALDVKAFQQLGEAAA
jgi:putative ABC transport system ATP-binding protein